jgi:hypothetical protein
MVATPHGFDHPTVHYVAIVKALLDAGADVPVFLKDEYGQTVLRLPGKPSPLIWRDRIDNPEIIRLLDEARKKNERD